MVKHLSGKLILVASAAFVVGHQEVSGQHGFHKNPPVESASCAIGQCPTNFLTYGFFQENWRRWPEESAREIAAAKSSALNPFVIPDRNKISPIIPNSRDEAVQVPRKRKPIEATAEDASVQSIGQPSAPAPVPNDNNGLMELEGLPSEVPGTEPGVPGTEPIPEIPDGNNLFGPSDDDTLEPSEPKEPESTEDEFDFDSLDLSNDSQRQQRAGSGRKTASQPKTTRTAASLEPKPRPLPQLVARELGQEIHHDVTRVDQVAATVDIGSDDLRRGRNPLRFKTTRKSRPVTTVQDPAAQSSSKATLDVPEVRQTQARTQRTRSSRSNPLRRR
ncbi:MAG: hypothetical protein P8N76_20885 [Pirellulaceae bacterium]|nr:hypothetical protein [Pirellulaceae bacterium]